MTLGDRMDHRTEHTYGRTIRLDPPVRFSCCDECGKLAHIRPFMDMLVCDGCRTDMMLEECLDWPDDAA